MIIWGGFGVAGTLGDGAAYDPLTDGWSPTPSWGAPSARSVHGAVWTGSEMIIWGGYGGDYLRDGARLGEYYAFYLPLCSAVHAP